MPAKQTTKKNAKVSKKTKAAGMPENKKRNDGISATPVGEVKNATVIKGVNGVIPDGAYKKNDDLKTVQIENGVTRIGADAFSFCTGLTSVVIPKGIKKIDSRVFFGCSGLTSVVIPKGVKEIGTQTFHSCSALVSVVIPEGVTKIGVRAFAGCSSLASVTLPKSLKEIGDKAFSGCSSLTSVAIPDNVVEIGEKAFYDCSGLTSVAIPDNVAKIGDYAFWGCPGLTDVALPAHILLGRDVFEKTPEIKATVINGKNGVIPESACEGRPVKLKKTEVKKLLKTLKTDCYLPSETAGLVIEGDDNEQIARYVEVFMTTPEGDEDTLCSFNNIYMSVDMDSYNCWMQVLHWVKIPLDEFKASINELDSKTEFEFRYCEEDYHGGDHCLLKMVAVTDRWVFFEPQK